MNIKNGFFRNFLKEKLFSIFKKTNIFLKGKYSYSLKAGTDSEYIDFNKIYSDYKSYDFISKEIAKLIKKSFYNQDIALLGLSHTGIPICSLVANHLQVPFGYVRKNKKKYGTKQAVEGLDNKINKKVILIDDLIADPDQTMPFIKHVREEGFYISGLVVILEKLPPKLSKEVFKRNNINVISLFNFEEYLSCYRKFVKDK